jgi:formate/nitrite transporter FocA (FNT family)
VLAVLAAIAVAVVYGVLSEPFEFSLGLLVVAFCGGWLIGNTIAYGAWRAKEHARIRALQYAALVLSVLAWVGALLIAFYVSQARLPNASTSISSRLTLSGFANYFTGLDFTSVIHVIALALMAVMAWRGAR